MNDEGEEIQPETELELPDRQPGGAAEESERPGPGPPYSINYHLVENLKEDVSEQELEDNTDYYAFQRRRTLSSQYTSFYWKCMDLKSELTRLNFLLRSVGSSGPGILATNIAIRKLCVLRDLFGANALSLCPDNRNLHMFSSISSPSLTDFSNCFREFAESLEALLDAFSDFSAEYYDDTLMLLVHSLHRRFLTEADYISNSASSETQLPEGEWRNGLQDQIVTWIEDALVSLNKTLASFGEKGIPTILSAQQVAASRYLDLTTIATFLSGVTSSMIGLSTGEITGPVDVAMRTVFFLSLVLSICSAILSLMVMTWKKFIVRDPFNHLPPWACRVLVSGPMFTLLSSAGLFAVGLCLFVFSSNQHIVTTIMTVACTALGAFIILLASGWFLAEKWRFQLEAKSAGQALADESFVVLILDWFIAFLENLKPSRTTELSVSHSDLEDPVLKKDMTPDLKPGTHVGKNTSISNDAFLMSNAFAYENEARFQSHPVRTRERSYKVEVTSNSYRDRVPPVPESTSGYPYSTPSRMARHPHSSSSNLRTYDAMSFLPSMSISPPHDGRRYLISGSYRKQDLTRRRRPSHSNLSSRNVRYRAATEPSPTVIETRRSAAQPSADDSAEAGSDTGKSGHSV